MIGKELRRVWNAADGKAAEAELGHLVAAYRDSAPKLADWLETAIPDGRVEWLRRFEHAHEGMRFNDGKCDRRGRFWTVSMAEQKGTTVAV